MQVFYYPKQKTQLFLNTFLHKLALYSFAALFLLATSSCKQRGCMDTDAENYESKAGIDCGCCYFAGKGLGWYRKAFYDKMKSAGVTALKYYVNDQLVNETNYISVYSMSPPTFAVDNSSYMYYTEGEWNVVVVNLEGAKLKILPVRVTDQNGSAVWSGNVAFQANTIIAFELF